MRFYANLAGVWAVTDVCYRCQVLQILLLSLIMCPFLTSGFSKFYSEGAHVPSAPSAITLIMLGLSWCGGLLGRRHILESSKSVSLGLCL